MGVYDTHKKNRIQVSNTKKPLFFYVNLAKVMCSPCLPTSMLQTGVAINRLYLYLVWVHCTMRCLLRVCSSRAVTSTYILSRLIDFFNRRCQSDKDYKNFHSLGAIWLLWSPVSLYVGLVASENVREAIWNLTDICILRVRRCSRFLKNIYTGTQHFGRMLVAASIWKGYVLEDRIHCRMILQTHCISYNVRLLFVNTN